MKLLLIGAVHIVMLPLIRFVYNSLGEQPVHRRSADLRINDWRQRHATGEVIIGRYAEERRTKRGDGPPATFDFLGFTHISGKTRRGDFTIHRKTSRKKFQAMWLNDLRRRSQRGRNLTWDKFSKLSKRWLPTPTILHPYPDVRFSKRQHPR